MIIKYIITIGFCVNLSLTFSSGFVCSLFVIPKKTGGFRPIVNLKPLNKFIKYEHFKMENLDSARFIFGEGD